MTVNTSAPPLDDLGWLTQRPVPLDHNGPVDVPFEPMGKEWHERSPIERFDYIVARHGERLAVDDGRAQLSYVELQRIARALANRIHAQAPAGPIALVFRYTALFPAAVLAGVAAGRPIIPVDAAHPLERQRMILDSSGAASVLVQHGVPLEVELPPVPVIEAEIESLCAAPDEGWPDVAFDPDAVAGATYTSGSTGRPKALAWSAGGCMPTFAANANAQHINPDDKIIALASHAATGLGDTMNALLNGASLRIVEIMTAGLAEGLRIMGEERVTILSFVPAVLRNVLQMDGAAHAFRHLRILDLHGDVTLAADVAFFRTKLPPTCHIRLLLGSMEAGGLFHWFVPRDFVADGLALPCGYLAEFKSVALLDEAGRPVSPGEPGELLARSRRMALGLWQDGRVVPGPFRPDPDDPQGRLYPMGDLVRMRPDGLAEFVGRRDRQVKVRGQRADLSDIEAALRQHPGIADVAVVASASTTEGDALITAYCVAADLADPPQPTALRSLVAAETAPHMAPARFRFLDVIPRLPNYKADLVKLAALAPDEEVPAARSEITISADPAILATVERAWRATLGAKAYAGRGWATAGGDSLKGLHLLFRIEEALGRRVPFDVLDENATAYDLAVAIGKLDREADGAADRPTILFLPGIGGDEPVLASFRREIASLGRIITVQYPGPEAPTADIGDLRAIGDIAIAQAGEPVGPLHIVGYSFGGIVALDVAERLRKQGRQVGLCAVLDTLPHALPGVAGAVPGRLRRIADGLREAKRAGRLYEHSVQAGARMLLRARAARVLRLLTLALRPVSARAALNLQHVLVTALRGRAFAGWAPVRYPGPVWLFRSEDADRAEERLWRPVAPDLRIVDVQGTHRSMLSGEHGQALATALGAALAEATAGE